MTGQRRTPDQRDAARLTVAALNTRGIPLFGSRLAARPTAIADRFEASSIDVVSFQEVFTYWHLGLLARRMRSFRSLSYCIDFILASDQVKAESTQLVFPGQEPLRGGIGYLFDHVGLCARLRLGAWSSPGIRSRT